jgi:hypothetical protein
MLIRKFYRIFYQLNIVTICFLGVLFPLLFNLLFNLLDVYFGFNSVHEYEGYTLSVKYVITIVIIAPLIETLLFQYLPLKCSHFFLKQYKYHYTVIILLSSLIFGSFHLKFRIYPIIAFCYGIIWAFCCFLFIRKKQHPILYTTVIHACYNGLLAFLTFVLAYFDIDL